MSAQDRAVALMDLPRFQDWLVCTESAALFVNGNYDPSARLSPLSYICAKLYETLSARTTSISILTQAHFCGLRMDNLDLMTGPSSMMRNLLSQLLISFSAFAVAKVRQLLEVDCFDMEVLCQAFSEFIKELPRRFMVICVVDGLTLYEDSLTHYDMALEALQSLLEIVEYCKTRGCTFKLLVTSSGSSREYYREFDDEEIIWLPQTIEPRGGLTTQKWADGAGAQAEDLLETS